MKLDWSTENTIGISHINDLLNKFRTGQINCEKLVEIDLPNGYIDELFYSYILILSFEKYGLTFGLNYNSESNFFIAQHFFGHIPYFYNDLKKRVFMYLHGIERSIITTDKNLRKLLRTFFSNKELKTKHFESPTGNFKPQFNLVPKTFEDVINNSYLDIYNNLGVGKLLENENYKYAVEYDALENKKDLFYALKNHLINDLNTIELLLFNIYVSYDISKSKIFKTKNKNGFEKLFFNESIIPKFDHIKDIVKKIAFGVTELYINAYEHTNKGVGLLNGRILEKNRLQNVKSYGSRFRDWISNFKEDVFFLEINVIDNGDQLLLDKINKDLKVDYEKISKIQGSVIQNEPYFTLKDFLNPEIITNDWEASRIYEKIGLKIFFKTIVQELNGYVKLSSYYNQNKNEKSEVCSISRNFNDERIIIEKIEGIDSENTFVKLGTTYSIIIPLETFDSVKAKPHHSSRIIDEQKGIDFEIINEQFQISQKLEIINVNSKINFAIDESEITISKYDLNQIIFDQVYPNVVGNEFLENKPIKILDLRELKLNGSDLFRLMALFYFHQKNDQYILVIDNKAQIDSLSNVFNHYNSKIKNLIPFLVFAKHTSNTTISPVLWFNYLFADSNQLTNYSINREIGHYHFNLSLLKDLKPEKIELDSYNSVFLQNRKLLHFELVIKLDNSLTLFEESLESLLKLPVVDVNERDKTNYFSRFIGYKIENSHFQLGSKIHIADFYFAKRLFYDSFYASRLAYILTEKIEASHSNILHQSVCILGYSYYSELLVSFIRLYLNEKGYKNVVHDVMLENENMLKSLSNLGDPKNNLKTEGEVTEKYCSIILVAPINSTFLTNKKIRKWVYNKNRASKFVSEDYSAILISDSDFTNGEITNQIYEDFGWEEINLGSKFIETQGDSFDSLKETIRQNYLIQLPTKWYKNSDCKLCIPENDSEVERCLIKTEANSVTPNLKFDLPNFKHVNLASEIEKFELLFGDSEDKLIVSDQIVEKSNHLNKYFFRTGRFLKFHGEEVDLWIQKTFNKTWKEKEIGNRKVILISPSRSSHSGFVYRLNRILFNTTARLIQINIQEDDIQNFKKFHVSHFENAYTIYVDDVMSSGESFFTINRFVTHCDFTINSCFCLVNKLNINDQKAIEYCIDKNSNGLEPENLIYHFYNFNLPYFQKTDRRPFKDSRVEYYNDLGNKSSLDLLRKHFYKEKLKANPKKIAFEEKELETTHEALFKFIVLQIVCEYFSNHNRFNFNDLHIFVKEHPLIFKFLERYNIGLIKTKKIVSKKTTFTLDNWIAKEIKNKILIILCDEPFDSFQEIKLLVFNEVYSYLKKTQKPKSNLHDFVNFLRINRKGNIKEYSKYQEFKMYLNLAGKLKINFLFDKRIFDFINWIHSQFLICEKEILNKKINIHPLEFNIDYAGIVQEMIADDEAKSYQLIKNIYNITNRNEKLSLIREQNNEYLNLLKLLVLENIFAFETFYQSKKSEINQIFRENKGENISKIKLLYENNHFNSIPLALWDFNEDIICHELLSKFVSSLKVKAILETEADDKISNENRISDKNEINDKLEEILKDLYSIISTEKESKEPDGGVFLVIRHQNINSKEKDITAADLTVYSKYYTGNNDLSKDIMEWDNSVVFDMFKGLNHEGGKSPRSYAEFNYIGVKEDQFEWDYRKKGLEQKPNYFKNKAEFSDSKKLYKNLFFLRIADFVKDDPTLSMKPLAVLCFYKNPLTEENKDDKLSLFSGGSKEYFSKLYSPKYIRFLLFVRDELCRFIDYHLQNDAVAQYMIEKSNTEIYDNFSHGSEIIGKLLDAEVEKIKDSKIKNIDNYHLAKSIFISKSLLIAKANKSSLISWTEITYKDFESKVELIFKFLFTNENHGYPYLKDSNYNLSFTNFPDDLIISIPEDIIDDIIFEIVFNIIKHYIDYIYEPGMSIEIDIQYSAAENVVSFINPVNPEVSSSLKTNKPKGGLKIIEDVYKKNQKEVKFEIHQNSFKLKLPI